MADNTAIEWTHRPGTIGETWNPIAGCSLESSGCTNCYAMQTAHRQVLMQQALGRETPYAGTVRKVKGKAVWTGRINTAPDAIWEKPLRWTRPRTIFVNSMSDLFHPEVPDAWIDRVFATAALCPQHTFIILTKRAGRMREYVSRFTCDGARRFHVADAAGRMMQDGDNAHDYVLNIDWPLPNVWLGVSAEDQKRANERIPELLDTPAAIRFVSAEPLLAPIDFGRALLPVQHDCNGRARPLSVADLRHARAAMARDLDIAFLDWVIVGGESGPDARPMHPDWARSIRDQCADAGTAFFFKQWGSWAPISHIAGSDDLYHPAPARDPERSRRCRHANLVLHTDGKIFDRGDANDYHRCASIGAHAAGSGSMMMFNVGKRAAGRLLDGVEHSAFPADRSSG